MTVPTEIEAKLLVRHPAQLDAIARLQRIGSYPLRQRQTLELHSLYLDTREHALAEHGIALRLRQHGKHRELTGKWMGRTAGVIHERPELTVRLTRAPKRYRLPRGPLQCRLAAIIAGRPLRPILISDIVRQVFDVLPKGGIGHPLAELVLDRVQLAAPVRGRRVASYCEVEIELLNGTRRDVSVLAAALRQRFGLMVSRESKFARGFALLYGTKPRVGTVPERRLKRDDDGEIGRIAQQLWRLRQFDAAIRCRQSTTLADLSAAVSSLRAGLQRVASHRSDRARQILDHELLWFAALLDRVHGRHAERDRNWQHLRRAMASARYFRMLVRLERYCAKRGRRGARQG